MIQDASLVGSWCELASWLVDGCLIATWPFFSAWGSGGEGPHMAFPWCTGFERERLNFIVSLFAKALILCNQDPTLTFSEAASSNRATWRLGLQGIWILGGYKHSVHNTHFKILQIALYSAITKAWILLIASPNPLQKFVSLVASQFFPWASVGVVVCCSLWAMAAHVCRGVCNAVTVTENKRYVKHEEFRWYKSDITFSSVGFAVEVDSYVISKREYFNVLHVCIILIFMCSRLLTGIHEA